jgi:hypothetical protein
MKSRDAESTTQGDEGVGDGAFHGAFVRWGASERVELARATLREERRGEERRGEERRREGEKGTQRRRACELALTIWAFAILPVHCLPTPSTRGSVDLPPPAIFSSLFLGLNSRRFGANKAAGF